MSLPKKYIDFSVNTNPFGPPKIIGERWHEWIDAINDYPDPKTISLKQKLANKDGVAEESILVGNGGAELITLIARMLQEKRVLIVQPAFSEYEAACRASRCHIFYHLLQEGDWELDVDVLLSKLAHVDAIFLCTPNNPTGVTYSKAALLKLLQLCNEKNVHVIVDEAFYDFYAEYSSLVTYITKFPNLIIIRSLTKMYAIAGIRLGYVISQPKTIQKLAAFQPHWSVNALALKIGEVSIEQSAYVKKTQNYIMNERERIFRTLKELQFIVSTSKVNFYLMKDPHTHDQLPLFRFLLKKGIIPRHTANFPGIEGRWLRLAVKQAEDHNQLAEALTEWRKQS